MDFKSENAKSPMYSASPVPHDAGGGRFSSCYELNDMEQKDKIYKRRIRILRLISRIAALILNGFMVGALSFSLAKYLLTKNRVVYNNQSIWANPTTLWPTIMLLSISGVTFIMDFFTICAYMCGVGAANKTSSVASVIGYVMLAGQIVVWAVSTGAFKMANNGHDLWSYTCGTTADAIQEQVKSYMNFGTLCTVQQGAWYTSIIQTAMYAVAFILTILIFKRASHKKKMERVKSGISMNVEYGQENAEFGKTYRPAMGQQYARVPVESPHV